MKKSIRVFAFLLAILMTFTLTGCREFATDPSTTHPSESDPANSTSGKYDTEDISALIAKLQAATSGAVGNYTEAMDLITADYEGRPEGTGTPEFKKLAADLMQTREDRLASLSGMIRDLKSLDLSATATVAAKISEAENMLSADHHAYGDKILHSRNVEGTPCIAADYYQICTKCNAVKWSKGEHQWYYSRNMDEHQKCCRMCIATFTAVPHDVNDHGQCTVCNYKLKANILIIENIDGESDKLSSMIDSGHTLTVVNVKDSEKMPASVEDLQNYDEVILVNIANRDMPQGFDKLLQSYVQDFGGGLLTVGGNTADSTPDNYKPNAYDKADMQGTVYQDMLPVDIMDPMSSIGVLIIIDSSGSMWDRNGGEPWKKSKLYAAKQGAEACLGQLQDDDYVGILGLSDSYEISKLYPLSQKGKILSEIDAIELGGGTIFEGALASARKALLANTEVDRRHIILITDGLPGDPNPEMYLQQARMNAQAGITMSIVGINCDNFEQREMRKLAEAGGGEEKHFYDAADAASVSALMQEALRLTELRGITFDRFIPDFSPSFILPEMSQEQMPPLDGTYRSKLKDGAAEILSSRYGPLYAQWSYGKGKVGSFMCDLNGNWSSDFLNSEEGAELLNNIIIALFAGS